MWLKGLKEGLKGVGLKGWRGGGERGGGGGEWGDFKGGAERSPFTFAQPPLSPPPFAKGLGPYLYGLSHRRRIRHVVKIQIILAQGE